MHRNDRITVVRLLFSLLLISLLWASAGSAQSSMPPDANRFDLSGVPDPPTTFTEQQLLQYNRHNGKDAAEHEKLAKYYQSQGDTARADAEFEKARYWKGGPAPAIAPVPRREPRPSENPAPPSPAPPEPTPGGKTPGNTGALSGSFSRFSPDYRTGETWTFKSDGTYRLQRITPGVASHSENGTFRVIGDVVELTETDEGTSASSGPGPYGRSDTAGTRTTRKVQRLKFRLSGRGVSQTLTLDGKEYFRALDD